MIEAISQIVQNPWPFLIESLFSEFVVVVAGVLFAIFIRDTYIRIRYGGWKVIVKQPGKEDHVRPITAAKAKEIFDSEEELSVYLKGVASGYAWLNCDLITEGRELGMLVEDRKRKQFVIDMDKNPSKSPPTLAEIHAQIQKLNKMLEAFESNRSVSVSSGHPVQ